MFVIRRSTAILLLLVLVKLALPYFLIHPEYELQRDEYLHLDLGRHLAPGYISVPPLTSWVAWVILKLGGGTFWVRFFPSLFGALTLVVVWGLTGALGGGLFARVLATLSLLLSVVLRINLLFQPNSFDIFFWALLYASVLLFLKTGASRWIYAAGLAAGFGILSKYNLFFCLAGLVPAVLASTHRRLLADRRVWIAAALALLIIAPNLYWQWKHDYPTARQLRELADTQLVHVDRGDFLREQVLFFLNSLFVLVAGVVALLRFLPFRTYRFLLPALLISLCLFLYFRAKGYYAIGLYPVLLPFGAIYLEQGTRAGWYRHLRPVAVLLVLLLFLPLLLFAFPLRSPGAIAADNATYRDLGMLRWEDGRDHALPQDFADMIGWRALAARVDSAYRSLPAGESILVLTDNYGQAGAINHHSAIADIRAVSFNADYIYWMPLQTPIRHVILVKEAGDEDPQRTRERPLFDSVWVAGVNRDPLSREVGTTVYALRGARADINRLLRLEQKARWRGEEN